MSHFVKRHRASNRTSASTIYIPAEYFTIHEAFNEAILGFSMEHDEKGVITLSPVRQGEEH